MFLNWSLDADDALRCPGVSALAGLYTHIYVYTYVSSMHFIMEKKNKKNNNKMIRKNDKEDAPHFGANHAQQPNQQTS